MGHLLKVVNERCALDRPMHASRLFRMHYLCQMIFHIFVIYSSFSQKNADLIGETMLYYLYYYVTLFYMDTKELLKNLGLSDQEAQIYLALLELGPSLISRIAQYTGMHRPTIYRILPKLEAKDLVTTAPKGKQKLYIAETPEKLRSSFVTLKEQFEKTLPELQHIHDKRKHRPLIKFLGDSRNLAFIATDIVTTLKRGGIYHCYTTKRASLIIRKRLSQSFYTGRSAKQLQRFIITDALTDWQEKPDLSLSVKIIPAKYDFIDDNITQVIYGDKVAVADFETETGFIIESPLFANLQRKIFKALYGLF